MALRILAIETSGRVGSVAAMEIASTGATLAHWRNLSADMRTARSLTPAIGELLAHCGWRSRDLNLIAVTTGPGSFTGLRIGVTTAKTLAYAAEAQVAAVSTLAVIADQAGLGHEDRRVWCVLDAQRQELFCSLLPPATNRSSRIMEPTGPDVRIVAAQRWLAELRPGDVAAGPPLAKLRSVLPAGVEPTEEATWQPRADTTAKLGYQHYESGHCVETMQLIPQYYRRSAAEEKAGDRSGDEELPPRS